MSNEFNDDDLETAHNVLSDLKEMFIEEASEMPQEAKTLDSAMWYVEEQMPPELQDEYAEQ